ncbi:MAG: hypothetical protein KDD61_12605 [Bdellovibrionales bacterium]|nr:hypothetical protein [Bdellovibrionales bacterium]
MENRIRNILVFAIAICIIFVAIQWNRKQTTSHNNSIFKLNDPYEEGRDSQKVPENHNVEMSQKNNKSKTESDNTQGTNAPSRNIASEVPKSNGRSLRKYLHQEFPGDWHFQEDDNGIVFRVLGGNIPGSYKPDDIAKEIAKSILDNQEFELVLKPSKNLDQKYYKQQCKGHDVFKGQLQLFTSTDGQITMINTDLFKFSCKDIKLDPELLFPDAIEILKSHYGNRFVKAKSFIKSENQLMIWAATEPAQIAYFIHLTLDSPNDFREIIISAIHGEILADNDLIVY